MKIVNGVIVREGDVPPAEESSSSGLSMPSSVPGSIPLCGREVPTWQVGLFLGISLLFNGIGGLFFSSLIVGGIYTYGQQSSASNSNAGASGSGSSWNRMNTSSNAGTATGRGSNIKSFSDLPKAPASR